MNWIHNNRSIRTRIDRGQHKDGLVKQRVFTHTFRAERLLRRDDAQDVETEHILGLKHLDLVVGNPLEDRSLVFIALRRNSPKATDTTLFNGCVCGERQDDTNAIRQ